MFERRIQNQLHEWAEKNNRKPLILRGARQVGKTTIVEQFGKECDNFLSLNLEKKEAKDLFESTDDVKMLLPLLFLYLISMLACLMAVKTTSSPDFVLKVSVFIGLFLLADTHPIVRMEAHAMMNDLSFIMVRI